MAKVHVHDPEIELDSPILVEGLPGIGLVGKIAADHLVNVLEMDYYGACHCEGLPEAAVYHEGDAAFQPPVRIYADEANDLLVLQSDVPVSPNAAEEFGSCVTGWVHEVGATPLYLSGLPTDEKDDVPAMYGIGTGSTTGLLADHDIEPPNEDGVVSGPTGALLYNAWLSDVDAVGLIVESNPRFPDPEAARALLTRGIGPIAGIEVDTDELLDQAEQIREARQQLAARMQEADDESSRARPVGMYQ